MTWPISSTPAPGADVSFAGRFPEEFLARPRLETIPAWHLIGGKDPIDPDELTGTEPDDGYPVLLRDWIRRDGLKCLKVKLRGDDFAWDYDRLVKVGQIAIDESVDWLTADFNCTVHEPAYVNAILDRLVQEHPRTYGMLLYVEQPFPYDLEAHRIDVHSVSARKPLFMDESAHDWRFVRLGRELGWSGVALKTCKTQTGALLSLCWAKAHGMTLMVQDLSNPMLAQIPHVLLGGPCRHDHGRRVQRHAVLSGRIAARGRRSSRPFPAPAGLSRSLDDQRVWFWVSSRRDRAKLADPGVPLSGLAESTAPCSLLHGTECQAGKPDLHRYFDQLSVSTGLGRISRGWKSDGPGPGGGSSGERCEKGCAGARTGASRRMHLGRSHVQDLCPPKDRRGLEGCRGRPADSARGSIRRNSRNETHPVD